MSHAQDPDHGVHVPVGRDAAQMTDWRRWLIAVCLLASTGCAVSQFSTQSETGYDQAPDRSIACGYSWQPQVYLGHLGHGTDVNYRRIDFSHASRGCVAAPDRTPTTASVNGYYSEFYDSSNRLAMVLPVQALNGLTLGHAPMSLETHVIVCLEAKAVDLDRAAMARGSVEWNGNVWAAREARSEQVSEVTPRLVDRLVVQAWNKLWTPGATLPPGATCREAIETERDKISW